MGRVGERDLGPPRLLPRGPPLDGGDEGTMGLMFSNESVKDELKEEVWKESDW